MTGFVWFARRLAGELQRRVGECPSILASLLEKSAQSCAESSGGSLARALRAQGEPCASLARALRARLEPCARKARPAVAHGSQQGFSARLSRELEHEARRAQPLRRKHLRRKTLLETVSRACESALNGAPEREPYSGAQGSRKALARLSQGSRRAPPRALRATLSVPSLSHLVLCVCFTDEI